MQLEGHAAPKKSEVVATGRIRRYKLCYKVSIAHGSSGKRARRRVPLTDYIDKASVQGNLQISTRGTLSKASSKYIDNYVLGVWDRADD